MTLYILLVLFVALCWCWRVVGELMLYAVARVAVSEYERSKR